MTVIESNYEIENVELYFLFETIDRFEERKIIQLHFVYVCVSFFFVAFYSFIIFAVFEHLLLNGKKTMIIYY